MNKNFVNKFLFPSVFPSFPILLIVNVIEANSSLLIKFLTALSTVEAPHLQVISFVLLILPHFEHLLIIMKLQFAHVAVSLFVPHTGQTNVNTFLQ